MIVTERTLAEFPIDQSILLEYQILMLCEMEINLHTFQPFPTGNGFLKSVCQGPRPHALISGVSGVLKKRPNGNSGRIY